MKDIAVVFTAVKLKDYKSGRAVLINLNKIIAITESTDGDAVIICREHIFHVQESVDEVMDIIAGLYEENERSEQ